MVSAAVQGITNGHGPEDIGALLRRAKSIASQHGIDPAVALETEVMSYRRVVDLATERGDSEIQMFYKNRTVFVTGGSGFLGKQLIEKLFRSCDIKKAYVMIRPKKGKAIEERRREMLNDPVFEEVRKQKPTFEERIVVIEGNVAKIGLGISEKDWSTIIEEVDVIFHVAATVRFDEKIQLATLTNVRGTREALKLGDACKNLRSFVHVSTAYSHATSGRAGGDVTEEFYETPAQPDHIIHLAETNVDELEEFTARHIKGWPNTYTFTKAVAEEVVRTYKGDMKISIVRPSIVIASYIEPVPGWLDVSCVHGPTGILVGIGLGVIHVLVDNQGTRSFIPVDFVNNATIAAGWDAARRNGLSIFNISSTSCGITIQNISKPLNNLGCDYNTPKAVWYCYTHLTNNSVLYWLLSWLCHYIPAYMADAVIKVFMIKTPKEMKSMKAVYDKYDKMSEVFSYFLTKEWNFDETNLMGLWGRMSDTDKLIYNFEIKTIDWDRLCVMWYLGMRKYIIKDGLKNTIQANRRQKWLKLGNYVLVLIYFIIAWKFISVLMFVGFSLIK